MAVLILPPPEGLACHCCTYVWLSWQTGSDAAGRTASQATVQQPLERIHRNCVHLTDKKKTVCVLVVTPPLRITLQNSPRASPFPPPSLSLFFIPNKTKKHRPRLFFKTSRVPSQTSRLSCTKTKGGGPLKGSRAPISKPASPLDMITRVCISQRVSVCVYVCVCVLFFKHQACHLHNSSVFLSKQQQSERAVF